MSRSSVIQTTACLATVALLLVCTLSTSAQTKSQKREPCVQFSDLQAGSLTVAQQQDAKFRVRKYLWKSWQDNKITCADLTIHSTNGTSFKWTYSITTDRSHKKQLTVQFFDKQGLESTLTAFSIRRWQNNPNYALELLDENGRPIGIL